MSHCVIFNVSTFDFQCNVSHLNKLTQRTELVPKVMTIYCCTSRHQGRGRRQIMCRVSLLARIANEFCSGNVYTNGGEREEY